MLPKMPNRPFEHAAANVGFGNRAAFNSDLAMVLSVPLEVGQRQVRPDQLQARPFRA